MKNLSNLEDHLGYWMRFVSNHVSHAFKKKLEKYDLGVAEWIALRKLYLCTTLSPSALVEMTGMTKGAVSKLLDRLYIKNLIERVGSSRDRRVQEITLSKEGRKLIPKLAALADLNDCQFFDHLSENQKQVLIKILKQLVIANGLSQIPIN